jgi:Tfp pilus assembly protein PilO
MTPTLIALSWPTASVIIAFILFIAAVATAGAWGSGKASIIGEDRNDYRKLAESLEGPTARSADLLETMSADLADVRTRLAEVERMLKEV